MTLSLAQPEVLAFVLIPLVLVAMLVWAVSVTSGSTSAVMIAVATSAWMAYAWRLGTSGVLRRWNDTPPPLLLLVAAIIAIAMAIAFGPIGTRLANGIPLWALVASQAFRLPLELAMHQLAMRGIMPAQMTYSGRNLDILTGATAVVVAVLLATRRAGQRAAWLWNVGGSLLLVNIVVVAILSTPRFAAFGSEPDRLNVFVTEPPFVWLPAIMVLAALAGHLLIFRRLLSGRT